MSGAPEKVVLRIYDDKFIYHFDRKTKTVGRDISILNSKEQSMSNLKLESLGPLVMERLIE